MFELEVDHAVYNKAQLRSEIQDAFESNRRTYAATSVLQWEEHCTECAMPQCYESCDLYEPRKDGKCRRFIEGISPVQGFSNYQNLVKVSFKKWGSLMATGFLHIVDFSKAMEVERKAAKVAAFAATVPDSRISILGRHGISSRLATRYKRLLVDSFLAKKKLNIDPDYFLLEIYNPNDYPIDITFVIRASEGERCATPYQERLNLAPGFHRLTIDYQTIHNFIDPDKKHFVSLTPNLEGTNHTNISVYFGHLGFMKEKASLATKENSKSVKVIAWDLDNTVWKGILVEDGPDNLELMPDIRSVMETLDKRGIVNSVVSKNNSNEALNQLKRFGLEDLIVFPQISWNPKSQSIKMMIREFNIGEDATAFIDDSPFEREEVKTSNPGLRVYDADSYLELPEYPEFNPKQSTESSRRREFYKNQGNRNRVLQEFPGDYLNFIKSCAIRLSVSHPNADNANRIQELVQRTNQLNFSGNRYERAEIDKLFNDSGLDKFCISCEDKFGDYGTVGFCVVDNKTTQLIDLMFSCRVQSKRIEHAFLAWLLHRYRRAGLNTLKASYNKTPKNAPAGKVFKELGFIEIQKHNNTLLYEFELKRAIPWDGLITIEYEGTKWEP